MPKKKQKPQEELTIERVKEMEQQIEEDKDVDPTKYKNHVKNIPTPFDEIVERIVRVPKPKKD